MLCCSISFRSLARLIHIAINRDKRRDANGSQNQRHPGFSSTLPNTRFCTSLRRFFVRLIRRFRSLSPSHEQTGS